jgi:RNA polymerase sigma factor (sigma-70 family)
VNIELPEQELLKRLAKHDKQAAETIYKQHYNMVQAMIINNNGTTEEARDIFQETMIVLFEKARSGSFELNSLLKTFIYSVSRRLWLKRLQQMQRFGGRVEHMAETVPVEEELEGHATRNSQFQAMEASMMNLGEPCKSLLEAYYLEKRSMTDIADSFGYTNADNAKNQKYKCLIRLKKLFFAQHKKNEK